MEYGAIDLHVRYTWIRLVDAGGQVLLERRVPTTAEALRTVLRGRPAGRILIESGTDSEWVARVIEGCGHEVVMAAPSYALMYGHRDPRIKTDRRDVVALCEACRVGIYKRAHRVSDEQRGRRRALTVRAQLVRQRTALINLLRAELRQEGCRLRRCSVECVPRAVAALAVPPAVRTVLTPILTLLEALHTQIAACTTALEAVADPVVARLQTVPGVGPLTALTFRAVLDEVQRFGEARQVAAYVGLVPSEASSGERRRRGRITKAGPPMLRSLLIQASWTWWRHRRGGAAIHAWVERVAARRGKRIAVVALARRLARILYAMWRDGTTYRVQPA